MAEVETENGNGNMEEEMDDVQKEMIQGRSGGVKGIIFPPPDIRAVVDKTAQWCVVCVGRGCVGGSSSMGSPGRAWGCELPCR